MAVSNARRISELLQSIKNCIESNNEEWRKRFRAELNAIMDRAPSGSGWDCGTTLDMDLNKPERLVFTGSFHHMDENGFYSGWTEHKVTVRPSFSGLDIRISGRNRNDIKDYLHDMFSHWLNSESAQ